MKILEKLASKNKGKEVLKAVFVDNGTACAVLHSNYDIYTRISKPSMFKNGIYKAGIRLTGDHEDGAIEIVKQPLVNNFVKSYKFNLQDLLSDLEYLKPAMSKKEARYYLNGVCFVGNDMVATDGHRLHKVKTSFVFDNPDYNMGSIVHRDAIDIIILALKAQKKTVNDVSVALHNDAMTLLIGKYLIETVLIDGTYSDYERVIPDIGGIESSKFYRKDFKDAYKKLNVIRKAFMAHKNICVTLEGGKLEYGTEIDDWHTEIDIHSTFNKRIGFNLGYLRDIPDGDIYIIDNTSPATIKHDKNRLTVLMPVRV